MQSAHIIAGFSDIKLEFQIKTRTPKRLDELKFWFTFKDNLLCMHDYCDHQMNIILAAYIQKEKSWHVYLRPNSYGEQVIKYVIKKYPQVEMVAELYALYKSHGFISL